MQHFQACAVGVNSLSKNVNAMKKNTEAVLDTGKEVGAKINGEKTNIWSSFFTRKQDKIIL
jgi:hypothetical protein